MKLLIVTQVVDIEDLPLGFFHRWIEECAKRFESIEVICLREGKHALPENVRVHTLGKESGSRSRVAYAATFLSLTWKLRHDYDAVFVHQNQEYLLIAGWLWKALKKPAYLWRNHYAGSWLTDVAAFFCTKVFCTSRYSYTAKYKKNVLMPVGVDTDRFYSDPKHHAEAKSILFFGRMTPSKRPDLLIEALGLLLSRGISFTASVYGSPAPKDKRYHESLQARAEALGLHDRVRFFPGSTNDKAPEIFRSHEIYVNSARSGMFDKMLFEAAACGCLVLAASKDYAALTDPMLSFAEGSEEDLSNHLSELLIADKETLEGLRKKLESVAIAQSLTLLMDRLASELT